MSLNLKLKKSFLPKKWKKTLKRIFTRQNVTKFIVLISTLALIASYTLPYIIR